MSGEQQSRDATIDQPRAVLDQQTTTMRHLNDELFRTVRVHLLIAGALITTVSMLGYSSLLPPANASALDVGFWATGGTLTASATGVWLQRITTTRLSYTDMEIGAVGERAAGSIDVGESVVPSVVESYRDCIESNDELLRERERNLNETQRFLNAAVLVVVIGLLILVVL